MEFAQIPLSLSSNNLVIDFEAITGTSFTSDIAIDDITITATQVLVAVLIL